MIQKFKDWWKDRQEPRFKPGDVVYDKHRKQIVELIAYATFRGISIARVIYKGNEYTTDGSNIDFLHKYVKLNDKENLDDLKNLTKL